MIKIKTDQGETMISTSCDSTGELIADACVIFNNIVRLVAPSLHMSEANTALEIYQLVATTLIDSKESGDER